MAATIPNWLLGRHVTAVQAWVQTINESTGALDDVATPTASNFSDLVLTTGSHASGTIVFTTGVLDEIRLVGEKTTDNINSVNRQFAHHVPLQSGYTLSVSEVMRSSVAGCLLANIWFGGTSNYIRFTFGRGGNHWEFICIMTGYNETIVRGKNVANATLVSVDNGGGTYTVGDR